jgi:hypothetical protein
VTFRGPQNFRLVYGKVNGRVLGTRDRELVLHTNFQYGAAGWRGSFSDYSLVSADTRTIAEIRYLPEEAGAERTGFYLQSMNRSDDMFMYLRKVATHADGIGPNRAYRVQFEIAFQSNAGKGCAGVGGAPGEGVYLKAGATPGEPVAALERGSFLALNINKGFQSTGGRDAGVAGDIANGIDCGPELYRTPVSGAHMRTQTSCGPMIAVSCGCSLARTRLTKG